MDAENQRLVTIGRDTQALNKLMKEVRALADAKQFNSGESRWWEMFALIHSEVSEAVDKYKKGASNYDVAWELIDCIIRILHMLSSMDVDPDLIFDTVMTANWKRPIKYNTVRGG